MALRLTIRQWVCLCTTSCVLLSWVLRIAVAYERPAKDTLAKFCQFDNLHEWNLVLFWWKIWKTLYFKSTLRLTDRHFMPNVIVLNKIFFNMFICLPTCHGLQQVCDLLCFCPAFIMAELNCSPVQLYQKYSP